MVRVDGASELVTNFDTQTPQVLIESNIVEAQTNFLRDLGIQWGQNFAAGPGTGNSTPSSRASWPSTACSAGSARRG